MKHEIIFGAEGVYTFEVKHNILLHNEAAVASTKVVKAWLAQRRRTGVIRFADLACGASPLIPDRLMRELKTEQFKYVGVDIHPDQIENGRRFQFSNNVNASFVLGDVWNFASTPYSEQSFDIVFMGLNLHHGSTEQIRGLSHALKKALVPSGLFINYDIYRPEEYPYRKPPEMSEWTSEFCKIVEGEMARFGATQEMLRVHTEHCRQRDYPVSLSELRILFGECGMQVAEVPCINPSNSRYHCFKLVTAIPK